MYREYSVTIGSRAGKPTGTHVVPGTSVERNALASLRREPKVGNEHAREVLVGENVLGLQVAVEYTLLVARLDAVEDLKEDALHERVVPCEHVPPAYLVEQVPARAEVHDIV